MGISSPIGRALAALGTTLAVGGCADAPQAVAEPRLAVYAPAALAGALTDLADAFERNRPGLRIVFTFGPSASLAEQLNDGATADVFVADDERAMRSVVVARLAATGPRIFARSRLAIVVADGNPMRIDSLDDLSRGDLAVARCAARAPCGAATDDALDSAGVRLGSAAEEGTANAVLTRVTLGEADAGLLRRSEAFAAQGQIDLVDVPQGRGATSGYQAVWLTNSARPQDAAAWVGYLTSDKAQTALRRAGLDRP
ncbi:molybdate ABC transporter substrate-binding protein [Pilimelia columellifera]|uniref:Molybdate ABC transporter substrate-binding protein n=1 Tax=Pilimelia columellifera subsp. columellifera TaxID=706583 RepID=A0ABN3N8B3_9ACTN